jgi:hypothetical protein
MLPVAEASPAALARMPPRLGLGEAKLVVCSSAALAGASTPRIAM